MAFYLVELEKTYRATVIVEASNKNQASQKALLEVTDKQWHANPVEVFGVFDDSEVDKTIFSGVFDESVTNFSKV